MASFTRIGTLAAAILLAALASTARAAEPSAASARSAEKAAPHLGLWTWKGPKTGNEHWVHVPENYNPALPCPIFVMSHGIHGNGAGMIKEATCTEAVRRGWIAVAPTWRWNEKNWEAESAAVADELPELIKLLAATCNVDKRTIVSSGFSGGGGVSIRSFTKFPDLYSYLVSQSSNFYGSFVAAPLNNPPGAAKRPVAIFWGANDNPMIPPQAAAERNHFTRAGYPTTSYVVPGGGHQTEPHQTWAWLDALLLQKRADELEAGLKTAAQKTGPEAVEALAPFLNISVAATEKKIADSDDDFVKEWQGKFNATLITMTENLAKCRSLYQAAVEIGQKLLAGAKFDPTQKQDSIGWVRRFKATWAAAPDLCRAADAAFEKAYGEKLPELPKK